MAALTAEAIATQGVENLEAVIGGQNLRSMQGWVQLGKPGRRKDKRYLVLDKDEGAVDLVVFHDLVRLYEEDNDHDDILVVIVKTLQRLYLERR